MSLMSASLAPAASAVQEPPSRSRATRADLMQCIILSSDYYRTRLFDRAAEDQGWDTILAVDAEGAMQVAARERLRLAIVDLQSTSPNTNAAYRRFVDWLSNKRQSLVVVCGKEDDPTGEIWSRQLGVWMYLPGVDDQTDIALVCGEARNVSEKLHGPVTNPIGSVN